MPKIAQNRAIGEGIFQIDNTLKNSQLLRIPKQKAKWEPNLRQILEKVDEFDTKPWGYWREVYHYYEKIGILDQPLKPLYITILGGERGTFSLGPSTLRLYEIARCKLQK